MEFFLTCNIKRMCCINAKLMRKKRGLGLWCLGKKSSVREQKWKRKFFPAVKASPALPRLPYIVKRSELANLSVSPMARGSGGQWWIEVLVLEDGERSYDRQDTINKIYIYYCKQKRKKENCKKQCKKSGFFSGYNLNVEQDFVR